MLAHRSQVVPNVQGRVLGPDGAAVPGLYVSGWMKRGPSGVIGTNRTDAEETVTALWHDVVHKVAYPGLLGTILQETHILTTCQAPPSSGNKTGWLAIEPKLKESQVSYVLWPQWKAIEAEEERRGKELGKEREKLTSLREMLGIAEKQ